MPIEDLTKQQAIELAQAEVREIVRGEKVYMWNSTSEVTEAFPVCLDGWREFLITNAR